MAGQQHRFTLGRFRAADASVFAGIVVDDMVVRLDALTSSQPGVPGVQDVNMMFAAWDDQVERLAERAGWLRERGPRETLPGAVHQLAELTTLSPVQPTQVFQSGANYRTHVIELLVAQQADDRPGETKAGRRARAAAIVDERAATGMPYVFTGLPTAICGPRDDVVLPAGGTQHDWELELAAVIGRPARRVHRDVALSYVAGYTIVNDITTRDRVYRPDIPGIGTDWLASKNAPTFLPTGPYLVPAAFIDDPMKLRIVLRLNGETMQDACTAEMIFDIARLIEYASSLTELLPGDLLLTGSPAGNGIHHRRFLRPGDVMEGEITELGMQRNRCVADQPSATPFRP
jgi:2-keto-4-pentenoate hydratase/2-oxohepta-3-ene-1,7-dioic acid hydratase in catechol pathway